MSLDEKGLEGHVLRVFLETDHWRGMSPNTILRTLLRWLQGWWYLLSFSNILNFKYSLLYRHKPLQKWNTPKCLSWTTMQLLKSCLPGMFNDTGKCLCSDEGEQSEWKTINGMMSGMWKCIKEIQETGNAWCWFRHGWMGEKVHGHSDRSHPFCSFYPSNRCAPLLRNPLLVIPDLEKSGLYPMIYR